MYHGKVGSLYPYLLHNTLSGWHKDGNEAPLSQAGGGGRGGGCIRAAQTPSLIERDIQVPTYLSTSYTTYGRDWRMMTERGRGG